MEKKIYDTKLEALIQASDFIGNSDSISARKIINEKYPFVPTKTVKRNYTVKQMTQQFFSDGFVDRYSGNRLINPGLLRVISEILPDVFPYQAHWKTNECHMAYWDYQPTIDHIYPVSLGGKDSEENWVTTSMINNAIKSNFTLEQLGWTLKDKGDIKDWDGLSKIFINLVENDKSLLRIGRIKSYYAATKELVQI